MIDARPMTLEETPLIADYFLGATAEFLEAMGVDPTRLPPASAWPERFEREFARPMEGRSWFPVIWLDDGAPIGFSTADKIKFGESAFLHLHVLDSSRRNQGLGAPCVMRSLAIYFEVFQAKRLFSEPNAFNVAPNRTLQKAGFKYLKTHWTVPGALNFHQAVNRWMIEC